MPLTHTLRQPCCVIATWPACLCRSLTCRRDFSRTTAAARVPLVQPQPCCEIGRPTAIATAKTKRNTEKQRERPIVMPQTPRHQIKSHCMLLPSQRPLDWYPAHKLYIEEGETITTRHCCCEWRGPIHPLPDALQSWFSRERRQECKKTPAGASSAETTTAYFEQASPLFSLCLRLRG